MLIQNAVQGKGAAPLPVDTREGLQGGRPCVLLLRTAPPCLKKEVAWLPAGLPTAPASPPTPEILPGTESGPADCPALAGCRPAPWLSPEPFSSPRLSAPFEGSRKAGEQPLRGGGASVRPCLGGGLLGRNAWTTQGPWDI